MSLHNGHVMCAHQGHDNDRDMSKMSGHVKCPCTKDTSCVLTKDMSNVRVCA